MAVDKYLPALFLAAACGCDDASLLATRRLPKQTEAPCEVKQVLVFRHCVRSTPEEIGSVKDGFDFAQNYTDLPLPAWNTPENWCTHQGAKIMKYIGEQLSEKLTTCDSANNVKVISDTVNRDGTTALALLRGLSHVNETFAYSVNYDPLLFNSYEPDAGKALCEEPSDADKVKESQDALSQIPMPMGVGLASEPNLTRYEEVLKEMQDIIGIGPAGPWVDLASIPVTVSDKGKLTGAPGLLKVFSQNLLYSFASDIPYSHASKEQRYAFIAWQYWYRAVMAPAVKLAFQSACHVASVLEALSDPAPGLHIYAAHDGNLDALSSLLDISWTAPPFPSNDLPTPPGSAVLLTRHSSGAVSSEFLYPVFDGTDEAPIRIVSATPSSVQLKALKQAFAAKLESYDGSSCLAACEAYLKEKGSR